MAEMPQMEASHGFNTRCTRDALHSHVAEGSICFIAGGSMCCRLFIIQMCTLPTSACIGRRSKQGLAPMAPNSVVLDIPSSAGSAAMPSPVASNSTSGTYLQLWAGLGVLYGLDQALKALMLSQGIKFPAPLVRTLPACIETRAWAHAVCLASPWSEVPSTAVHTRQFDSLCFQHSPAASSPRRLACLAWWLH